MKIQEACRECVLNQAVRMADILGLESREREAILKIARAHIAKFDESLSPPVNAYKFYEEAARYLGVFDIYKDVKKASSKKAKEFEATCEEHIKNSQNPLLTATKIAVAGNVIDLASSVQYDLEDELEHILQKKFEIDDFDKLSDALRKAKNIVYLSDNAGEEVFDALYIKTIKKLYPDMRIYYFTRGRPIINDITYEEALGAGLNELALVINSGVPTPGFVPELASAEARAIFEKADFLIAKGMGNYECLSEYGDLDVFHLFKVKCDVVSAAIGATLGAIICKKA